MSKKISFEVKNIPYQKINSTLFVIGQYKSDKVDKNLDTLFDRRLTTAFKVDSFNGAYSKSIELYGNKNILKLCVVGLGDKKIFTSDKLRALAANIIRKAESNKISSISIDSNSFGLNNDIFAQAFAEGLMLGQYSFNHYKWKNILTNITG